jgi:hypothetical protein
MTTPAKLIVALCCISFAALAAFAAADGDVHLVTDSGGDQTLTGEQAKAFRTTSDWLEARLTEVDAIRIGSTYADVTEHFKRDGGIAPVTRHRFVSLLCPFLKIDVEFEEKEGVKARYPLAPAAKVVSVSKPYFERPLAD